MKRTTYYEVALHRFSVSGEEAVLQLLDNYEAFRCADEVSSVAAFHLDITDGNAPLYDEELRQEEEGQTIVCGHTADGQSVFEYRWLNQTAGWLICSDNYTKAQLVTTGCYLKMAVDNALMVLFALATAHQHTALFHAAAVSQGGKAYMFLGKSGTGKSTHAQLWLKHIEGTELVNDDNPVVRDNAVYGSPWSGKTPCYRNVHYPLGGIVLLSQAPYNKIQRLRGIEAYAALVPSISGKRWEPRIADGLHQTENTLAMTVPVWHLECLPNEQAAQECFQQIAQP